LRRAQLRADITFFLEPLKILTHHHSIANEIGSRAALLDPECSLDHSEEGIDQRILLRSG
jgi:hypothetical protein